MKIEIIHMETGISVISEITSVHPVGHDAVGFKSVDRAARQFIQRMSQNNFALARIEELISAAEVTGASWWGGVYIRKVR